MSALELVLSTTTPPFWKSSILLFLTVPDPVCIIDWRPISTANPFWQPLNGLSRMCVMWLCSITAEPPISTNTPSSRLSHPKRPGPGS